MGGVPTIELGVGTVVGPPGWDAVGGVTTDGVGVTDPQAATARTVRQASRSLRDTPTNSIWQWCHIEMRYRADLRVRWRGLAVVRPDQQVNHDRAAAIHSAAMMSGEGTKPHVRLRIGLMGTRGIPARYGGFETFYEHLGPRLAARGHDVSVYNRPHVTGHRELSDYRGVRLHHLPSIPTKHLDTISHTVLSVFHGATQRFDIVYICGVGNAPVAWVPRLFGARVVLNVDSADWMRTKWGPLAARYLRLTERFAGVAATVVVADNPAIRDRYVREHGIAAVYVPYGAELDRDDSESTLTQFNLVPQRYVLWVGRLEPETRVEELIEAFSKVRPEGFRLVILGDAPFATEYRARLHALASEDVVFTGYQFGAAYRQLATHAFAYVQTSPTSGTSPALLEQMAIGNAVIVRGTDTNRAVIADAGLSYPVDDPVSGLAEGLAVLFERPERVNELRALARDRARTEFDWDRITDLYEDMFLRLAPRKTVRHRAKRRVPRP